jgi:hypothetical protein
MELNMDCVVPIDSFVRLLPKRPSVCIGVGFLASRRSGLEVFRGMDLVGQLALGWMGQSHSRACVVRSTDRLHAARSAEPGLQEVYWDWLVESGKDPSEFSGQVLRDVAGLTSSDRPIRRRRFMHRVCAMVWCWLPNRPTGV